MKKLLLLVIVLSVLLSGCSKVSHGVVVGKNQPDYSVDIKLDDGDVKVVRLTKEQFYSGDFEVGSGWYVSCQLELCYPTNREGVNE